MNNVKLIAKIIQSCKNEVMKINKEILSSTGTYKEKHEKYYTGGIGKTNEDHYNTMLTSYDVWSGEAYILWIQYATDGLYLNAALNATEKQTNSCGKLWDLMVSTNHYIMHPKKFTNIQKIRKYLYLISKLQQNIEKSKHE
ncbi:MAG: hypothetical protein LBM05_02400 [Endomicrobium sp.]|jgi:hypothetical protein|nr:hypothetical protein [Endomicrobium sp.]